MFKFLRGAGLLLMFVYGVALVTGHADPVHKFTGYYLKQVEKTAEQFSSVLTKAGRGRGFSNSGSHEPSILRE